MSDAQQPSDNIQDELESGAAGHRGIPVDAVCTGCKKMRVKRAPVPEEIDLEEIDPDDLDDREKIEDALNSFKHVCHRCQGAEWWNPVSYLLGCHDLGGDDE